METDLGRRISVVGNSGSGKSMFAVALADALGLRRIELDGIFHQPGWAHLSTGAFRHAVRQALGAGDWVVDGNYRIAVPSVVWPAAETVVWLDYSRRVVVSRMVRRTVVRSRTGESICNGNVETLSTLWRRSGVLRWSVQQHRRYKRRYGDAMADPAWSHLRFVRLRSPAEADAFLATLRQAVARG